MVTATQRRPTTHTPAPVSTRNEGVWGDSIHVPAVITIHGNQWRRLLADGSGTTDTDGSGTTNADKSGTTNADGSGTGDFTEETAGGPTDGGKVLEDDTVLGPLTFVTGGFRSAMLANQGAEVVKIDQPGYCDVVRHSRPPFTKVRHSRSPFIKSEPPYHRTLSYEKKCLELELKDVRAPPPLHAWTTPSRRKTRRTRLPIHPAIRSCGRFPCEIHDALLLRHRATFAAARFRFLILRRPDIRISGTSGVDAPDRRRLTQFLSDRGEEPTVIPRTGVERSE